ncbi:phage portal protein, partial [Streptococcus suis]
NAQDVSSAVVVVRSQRSENGKMCYYTLFEIHEWVDESNYKLTNELYRSTEFGIVGERVPLAYLYDDLKEVVYFTGLSRPIFTYLKPPGMNNKDIGSPLGLSIFDNAKTTIDFINKTFDEFMWEVRMGQRRIAVSDKLTEIRVREENGNITFKPRFDVEQNVFMRLGTHDAQNEDVTDLTTPIRSDDYIKAINEGLSLFELQLGVSAGMFTFDGKSMKTATEIVSENSDTYQMRNSIATLVEQSLKELVISVLEVAKASGLYNGQIPSMDDISINLDDGVFTDRNAELDYWMKMVTAGFAPKSMAIEKTLNVTKEEALKLEKEINGATIDEAGSERSLEDKVIYGE